MARRKKKGTNMFTVIAMLAASCFAGIKYVDSVNKQDNPKSEQSYTIKEDAYEIPSFSPKAGGQIIKHKGYTLSYNADYKTAHWVGWELTAEETKGNETRTNKFQPDPDVLGAKAYTSDYTNSGYDRGHMAPAADMKWDKTAMEESFYLSNICPQNKDLNRGDWNDLEELSRSLARKYEKIYITCGPIYDTKVPKRIGNNKVAIPDAFYKVIFINNENELKAYGFIFNNKAGSKKLKEYLVSVDSIEERTGIDFMPTLSKEIQDEIEAKLDYSFSE